MTDAVFFELGRFLIQLFAALSGAALLWSLVFSCLSQRTKADTAAAFSELSDLTFRLFLFSAFLFFAGWGSVFFFFVSPEVLAHEGIVVKPTVDYLRLGFFFNLPIVLISLLSAVLAGWLFYFRRRIFERQRDFWLLTNFLLFSLIISFTVWTGDFFETEQWFFWLHGWHSILTLGTVLTVDFLYLATLTKERLRRTVYPFFPYMSAVIWIGLGLDFLSVFLILPEALNFGQQFFFNQTVIAIIILNGALLSGRINKALINLIKPEKVLHFSPRVNLFFGLSGSISMVSWLTITFLDFFSFRLNYWQFFIPYLAIIAAAFLIQHFVKKQLLAASIQS